MRARHRCRYMASSLSFQTLSAKSRTITFDDTYRPRAARSAAGMKKVLAARKVVIISGHVQSKSAIGIDELNSYLATSRR